MVAVVLCASAIEESFEEDRCALLRIASLVKAGASVSTPRFALIVMSRLPVRASGAHNRLQPQKLRDEKREQVHVEMGRL